MLPYKLQDNGKHCVAGQVKLPDHGVVLAPGEHFIVCLVAEFTGVLHECRVRFQNWRLLLL
jgi:hypothetical protein